MNQREDAAFHAQNNYIVWVKTAQQSKFWPWQLQLGTVFMIIKFRSQNVEISEVNIFLQNTINTLKAYKAPSPICLSLPTEDIIHQCRKYFKYTLKWEEHKVFWKSLTFTCCTVSNNSCNINHPNIFKKNAFLHCRYDLKGAGLNREDHANVMSYLNW